MTVSLTFFCLRFLKKKIGFHPQPEKGSQKAQRMGGLCYTASKVNVYQEEILR